MICKSCQEAGDTLALGRKLKVEAVAITLAEIFHRECTGCDCQHRLNNPHHA